jgi:hypothetical protein
MKAKVFKMNGLWYAATTLDNGIWSGSIPVYKNYPIPNDVDGTIVNIEIVEEKGKEYFSIVKNYQQDLDVRLLTPKDKAEQLITVFSRPVHCTVEQTDVLERAKKCALVHIQELLLSCPTVPYQTPFEGVHKYWWESKRQEATQYWNEVEIEIKKYGNDE